MAVLKITPATDLTTFIASAAVSPGDVLLLDDGVYKQSVIIAKSSVRIVANGNRVVFDGTNTLATGFILSGVTGVELVGLEIMNYTVNGIHISGGMANRILGNRITSVGFRGINVVASSGNLIWFNLISRASDGVNLNSGSTSNYVLENVAQNCSADGFESFLSVDANNVFMGNTSQYNQQSGFEIFGSNNLVLRNKAHRNAGEGFLIISGINTIAISNDSRFNGADGMLIDSRNAFVGESSISHNAQSGLDVFNDFNILQRNDISFNRDYGVKLNLNSDFNLIIRNWLVRNTPLNIIDSGANNNFVSNLSVEAKPTRPC